MYPRRIGKDGDYESLKKYITINIVDYKLLSTGKIHSVYHLAEDETGHYLTDVLEIHFIDLEKLRSGIATTENIDVQLLKWLRFLASKTKGEMEVEAKKDSEIMEAYECLQDISKDDRNRMAYEAREMWLMDQITREKFARKEGIEEGIKKGVKEGINKGRETGYLEGQKKIALNMLDSGFTVDEVVKLTDLAKDEVIKLK